MAEFLIFIAERKTAINAKNRKESQRIGLPAVAESVAPLAVNNFR
jgi:hypothetical protein